jgi:hypothetical protein
MRYTGPGFTAQRTKFIMGSDEIAITEYREAWRSNKDARKSRAVIDNDSRDAIRHFCAALPCLESRRRMNYLGRKECACEPSRAAHGEVHQTILAGLSPILKTRADCMTPELLLPSSST